MKEDEKSPETRIRESTAEAGGDDTDTDSENGEPHPSENVFDELVENGYTIEKGEQSNIKVYLKEQDNALFEADDMLGPYEIVRVNPLIERANFQSIVLLKCNWDLVAED